MQRRIIKYLSCFLVLVLMMTFVPSIPNVRAAEEIFYIYAWVLDENGNPLTDWYYEPGFKGSGLPSHEHLNKFGSALISTTKSSDNKYRYFKFGTNDDYGDYSENFTITKPFTVVKIQLAKKGAGTTSGSLILPNDAAYPKDPLNPTGAPENKVDIHGFVKDQNGGIANAAVTIKNPSKPQGVYSMNTTTDSNGYYYLSGVDEKRFGTYQIAAVKDGVTIPTSGSSKVYYSGSGFNTLKADTSYDFSASAVIPTPVYAVSVNGGTAAPAAAPAGTKINVSATIPAQKQFVNWTSSSADVIFENADSPATSFTMPNHTVSVQANYTNISGGNVNPPKPNPPESDDTETDETESEDKNDDEKEPSVKLNAKTAPLQKGKSSMGLAIESKYPSNDKVAKWTTSNKKIVKVDAKSGKIKGIAKGTAKITVTMKSGASATCKVTVQSKKVVTKKVALDKKKLTLHPKQKISLKAKKNPVTAGESLKWSTSNKKVAAVDSKGKITAKKAGTAVITVKTSNGKKAACKVTVSL